MAWEKWSKERKRLVEVVYEMSPEYHYIAKEKFVELYIQWFDKWRPMELKHYIRLREECIVEKKFDF